MGLQSSITGSSVVAALEHKIESLSPTKARVFECVRNQPGRVIGEVAQEVGCSHNNAARHLDSLREMGLLVREKEGRGVRHFCAYRTGTRVRLEVYLADPKKKRIIQHMANHPDREWNVNELARETGVYHTFLFRLLERLQRRGLVDVYRPGARYYTRPTRALVELISDVNYDDAPTPSD